jgi:hypothetical protein
VIDTSAKNRNHVDGELTPEERAIQDKREALAEIERQEQLVRRRKRDAADAEATTILGDEREGRQVSVKPPGPLDEAQQLFEAGSINDAARLLRRVRVVAAERGRVDVLTEVDDLASQMRAHLTGNERHAFDGLVAHGELEPGKREHARKFSAAWSLKVVGLAPIGGTALIFLWLAATANRVTLGIVLILVIISVTAALAYLAWRRPGLTGGLLVAFTPIGMGLGALGGSLWGVVWLGGVPLVSGLLFIFASLRRKRPTFTSSL